MARPSAPAATTMRRVIFPLLVGRAASAFTVPAAALARFDGHDMPDKLALAHSAVCAAADAGVKHAPQVLASALSTDGRWIWHADECDIVVGLLGDDETPLALAYARDLQATTTTFATEDGGTYILGDDEDVVCVAGGGSSPTANVLSFPPAELWCPQIGDCIDHLENIGLGMPVEIMRRPGTSCCEGLRDVLLSHAELSLAPPQRFLRCQPPLPLAVLAVYGLLLEGAGGSLTDAYGVELDLQEHLDDHRARAPTAAAATAGAGADADADADAALARRGVLAAVECMLPYFLRAIKTSFPESQLDGSVAVPPSIFDIPNLSREVNADADEFTVVYLGEGEFGFGGESEGGGGEGEQGSV